jgi:hypothetical protein
MLNRAATDARVTRIARVIVAGGLLALCLISGASGQPRPPEVPPDVQALVRAAIADRFATGDIPSERSVK